MDRREKEKIARRIRRRYAEEMAVVRQSGVRAKKPDWKTIISQEDEKAGYIGTRLGLAYRVLHRYLENTKNQPRSLHP